MYRGELTVLKFGSSVFRTEEDLGRIVEEIARWLQKGTRVVAVVSAMGDTTNALLKQGGKYGGMTNQEALAYLVATGEAAAAAILGLCLGKESIPAAILDPARIDLQAEGSLLDSTLKQVNVDRVRLALDEFAVVVVPGFVARTADGRTALLGRGGSDLTALFLAEKLQATRCRLLKDVDGLYEADPNVTNGSHPRRFKSVHWSDAIQLDGGIVQHKALWFAAEHRVSFEVGVPEGEDASTVGSEQTTFYD